MKKNILLSLVLIFAFAVTAYAADEKAATAGQNMPPMPRSKGMMNPNVIMLMGKVTKIDKSDPAKAKIEVLDSRDNKVHIVEIAPATNITKVTDISELKTDENVRIISRQVDGKEVAIGIMFGNFKKMPPRAMPPEAGMPGAGTPPPAAKKK